MKRFLAAIVALLFASTTVCAGIPPIPPAPPFSPTNSNQYIYNFDTGLLPHWRAAMANLAGPTPADPILCDLGESTELGVITIGSSASTYTNAVLYAQSAFLAKMFRDHGIPADIASWWGDGGSYEHSSSLPAVNPNITISNGGTSAATSPGYKVYGGGAMIGGNATGAFIDFKFTPEVMPNGTVLNADSLDIYYITSTSAGQHGTFTYAVDGGSTTTVSTNTAASIVKATQTGIGPGPHTAHIVVTGASGDRQPLIAGMEWYSSTQHRVRVRNMGYGGSQVSYWEGTGHPWLPGVAMSTYACTLATINIGDNDAINAIAVATTQANLQTFITEQQNSGATDVVLVTLNPQAAASVSLANQALYYQAELAAGGITGVPIIDEYGHIAPFSTALTYGFYGSGDNVHGTQAWYGDAAAFRWKAFAPLIGQATTTLDPHANSYPSAPTGCGSGTPTITAGSTDRQGQFTTGTTASGCTVTFGTAFSTTAPNCTFTDKTLAADLLTAPVTTSAIVLTMTSNSGDVVNYSCPGGL